jgi:cytochrome c553
MRATTTRCSFTYGQPTDPRSSTRNFATSAAVEGHGGEEEGMKGSYTFVPLLIVALAAGCTNLPRSRDLGNPDVAGETFAQQVCSNCHGVAGASISPNMPNLAAQQPAYISAQLKLFRSRGRLDPAGFEYMWGISRTLTDKQIDELAAYYAAQTLPTQRPEGSATGIDAGKPIFNTGIADKQVPPCSSCHGQHGRGNGNFPRIAGQHADYIVKQLGVFQRTDDRPEGAVMKTVAHKLTSSDITSVAAYLQAMPIE